MARLLSIVASQIRGSIGGLTFSGGPQHSIIARARMGPKRLMTNAQVSIRTTMSAASEAWNTFSQAQKNLWNQYAESVTFTGPLGTYKINGRLMFIRSYNLVLYMNNTLGASLVETFDWSGITFVGLPNIGPIVESAYVGPGTGVAFSIINSTAFDAHALVRVSPSMPSARAKSPGVWDGSLTQVAAAPNGVSTLVEIDNLVEDGYYFVSIRCVTDYDGASPHLVDNEIVLRLQAVTTGP